MSAFRMRSLCPGSGFFLPRIRIIFFLTPAMYFQSTFPDPSLEALISGTGYARQIRIQVCCPYFTTEFGLLIVYGSGFFLKRRIRNIPLLHIKHRFLGFRMFSPGWIFQAGSGPPYFVVGSSSTHFFRDPYGSKRCCAAYQTLIFVRKKIIIV